MDTIAANSNFAPQEKPSTLLNSDLRKEIIGKYSPHAYVASSIFHVANAGLQAFGNFSEEKKNLFTKIVTGFTKLVNSIVYGDLALDALKNKNSVDFISRILEPALNVFSQLSNYHLVRGLSSAMTQLHLVNFPHVSEKTDLWKNFIDNLFVGKKFFKEAWSSSLFGPNRKLFRGKEDQGHTMALASHVQAIAGIIGLLNGKRRNLIDKIVGTARNLSGASVDIELMFRKDKDERWSGIYYITHAVLDTVKRFLSKDKADIIDNLIMLIYNGAMYHFGKITRNQSDGSYETRIDSDPEHYHEEQVQELHGSKQEEIEEDVREAA